MLSGATGDGERSPLGPGLAGTMGDGERSPLGPGLARTMGDRERSLPMNRAGIALSLSLGTLLGLALVFGEPVFLGDLGDLGLGEPEAPRGDLCLRGLTTAGAALGVLCM